jgi:AmmeMemoRadiSam system protein B
MSPCAATRPPAVAGMFYPGDAGALQDELATCLAASPRQAPSPARSRP